MNQVYGFGSGKRGQLGVSKDRIKIVNLLKVVSGFDNVEIIDIAANGDHSAALSGKSLPYFPLAEHVIYNFSPKFFLIFFLVCCCFSS